MNILKKIKEIRGYEALHQKLIDLGFKTKVEKEKIDNDICDHIIALCKDPDYVEMVMKQFESDTYDVFLSIAQMNMMIQAFDSNYSVVSEDTRQGQELTYSYKTSIYPELERHADRIIDIITEDFSENHICDCGAWYLYTSKSRRAKNLYLQVTESDFEYLDDYEYKENFCVQYQYRKAIEAVHQMYKDNIERIGKIMDENIKNI